MQHLHIPDLGQAIHCPFCGQRVKPTTANAEEGHDPCGHTVLIATNEGPDHVAPTLEAFLDVLLDGAEDPCTFTDPDIDPGTVIVHLYPQAPSLLMVWYGFAPQH